MNANLTRRNFTKNSLVVTGTEWINVEKEIYPDGKSSMECPELSLAGLKKIWKPMSLDD